MRLHALRSSASPRLFGNSLRWVVLLVLLACVVPAWAEVPSQSVRQDGLVIYYGVLPAELLSRHELNAQGTHMSSRNALRSDAHHVVIALFDAKTGQRIHDAIVTARVIPLSGAPEEAALKPMRINDSMSFGNFFRLETDTPYVVHLRIRRADVAGKDVEAQFRYQHPTR
ncbi:MAG: hypothetical protein HYV16_02010 [Gammaproteobacteria bacterium]|nr:hypothetical protein [Gammaproteobacteria bacterium]